ncbi:hypothetical protein FE236_09375 [Mariprofundus erugo]|nr:hypothetical protein FE236_09375 [Mariprofundus erugo]
MQEIATYCGRHHSTVSRNLQSADDKCAKQVLTPIVDPYCSLSDRSARSCGSHQVRDGAKRTNPQGPGTDDRKEQSCL